MTLPEIVVVPILSSILEIALDIVPDERIRLPELERATSRLEAERDNVPVLELFVPVPVILPSRTFVPVKDNDPPLFVINTVLPVRLVFERFKVEFSSKEKPVLLLRLRVDKFSPDLTPLIFRVPAVVLRLTPRV